MGFREQKRSLEETLRDIEMRKRALEEQYRANQTQFEQQQVRHVQLTQAPRVPASRLDPREEQMERVREYQRRALQRRGDQVEQIRIAKENLQEKVKCAVQTIPPWFTP